MRLTAEAPWYVVPSDSKSYRNWAVAQIVIETLEPAHHDRVLAIVSHLPHLVRCDGAHMAKGMHPRGERDFAFVHIAKASNHALIQQHIRNLIVRMRSRA